MSSAFSSDSSHSRTWWSFSPKQPQLPLQDPHKPYPSHKSSQPSRSNGLHSIAVALGFKSKKHANTAVRSSQYPAPLPAISTTNTNNSDSLKSSSSTPSRSTLSHMDSIGPETPVDIQLDSRQSRSMPSDNNFSPALSPLSSHSTDIKPFPSLPNSSSPDVGFKGKEKAPNRVERALSHSDTSESKVSPFREFHQSGSNNGSPRKFKNSMGSLNKNRSLAAMDRSIGSVCETLNTQPSIYKSGSSTTLTDKNRLSQPESTPIVRPPLRARGMTESGAIQRPSFYYSEAVTPASPPQASPPLRVVIRQPSASRIGLPPSAPPSKELPLPPTKIKGKTRDEEVEVFPPPYTSSASSSSSLSFVSSAPPEKVVGDHSPRKKALPERILSVDTEHRGSHGFSRKSSPNQPTNFPHTLKKAISYQSLGKRGQFSSGSVSPPPDLPVPNRTLQKQRSFHQSKATMSPSIAPINGSNEPSPFIPSNEIRPLEPKRGSSSSGLSLPGRKRLFSGSSTRRPSTSHCIFPDDDARSLFSEHSESGQFAGRAFEPLQRQLSPTTTSSSCWDESSDIFSHSPQHLSQDYTPQKIMSSAEIAELAASLEQSSTPGRERGLSIVSVSTILTSDGEDGRMSRAGRSFESTSSTTWEASTPSTSTSSPVRKGFTPDRPSFRLSIFRSAEAAPPSTSDRDTQMPIPHKSQSGTHSLTSLPPPPRRSRARPLLVSEEPLPVVPSPPHQPSSKKFVRPRVSIEKILHRRSLMKKPSFLEIDDDTDGKETDVESPTEPQTGSFLDLARDSIDTMRSINE